MNYPNKVSGAKLKISSALFLIFFFILGFVITGILNYRLTREKQTTKSQAQGLSPIQEVSCTNSGGECQTGKADQVGRPCALSDGTAGTIIRNLCASQPEDIRCCVPNSLPADPPPALPSLPPQSNASVYQANITVKLQGIGPNANPQNTRRSATIKIFRSEGPFESATYTAQDTLNYDPASGSFINTNFNLGTLEAGEYQMVIQMEKYLDKKLSDTSGRNVFSLLQGVKVEVATIELRAGDIAPDFRGDNAVNIIDYNALIGCLPTAPFGACLNKDYADLNDDGRVDQIDLDILMSNFGENGFAFQTDQFKCEPDPSCNSGKDTLQLCSLLCTRKSQRS